MYLHHLHYYVTAYSAVIVANFTTGRGRGFRMLCITPQVSSRSEAHSELNSFRRKSESALIISGSSLELCIKHYEQV